MGWLESAFDTTGQVQVVNHFTNAIKKDEKNTTAWFYKAHALGILKKYEEALECYERLLNLDGKNAFAWYYKGSIFHSMRRYEESLECYEKAVAMDWNTTILENNTNSFWSKVEMEPLPDWQFLKASALALLRRYEESLECVEKAIMKFGNESVLLWVKASLLVQLERYEEGLEYSDKSLKIEKKNWDCLWVKGSALVKLERYKQANECFEKAFKIDIKKYQDGFWVERDKDEMTKAWNDKGSALVKLERHEEANECFDKAANLGSAKKEETSAFCENCGNSLEPKAKFCGKCGTART